LGGLGGNAVAALLSRRRRAASIGIIAVGGSVAVENERPRSTRGRERRVFPVLFHINARRVLMSSRAVRLHRVLRAKPEKLYRAFLEADALAKWLPPYGFTCAVHHLEAVVGGSFRMSFRNFSSAASHSFGGEYLELVPNQRIRYTDKFDDPNLPGVLHVTVILEPVICGTDLSVAQEGIPDAIPLEMCYLGWQESLMQLATLVEPEIPG